MAAVSQLDCKMNYDTALYIIPCHVILIQPVELIVPSTLCSLSLSLSSARALLVYLFGRAVLGKNILTIFSMEESFACGRTQFHTLRVYVRRK